MSVGPAQTAITAKQELSVITDQWLLLCEKTLDWIIQLLLYRRLPLQNAVRGCHWGQRLS